MRSFATSRSFVASLALILTLGFLGGCAVKEGKPFPADKRTELEKGMTPQEVESVLGNPESVERQTGRVYKYEYRYSETKPNPLGYVPVIGMAFTGDPDQSGDFLVVWFNEDERVDRWNYRELGDQ